MQTPWRICPRSATDICCPDSAHGHSARSIYCRHGGAGSLCQHRLQQCYAPLHRKGTQCCLHLSGRRREPAHMQYWLARSYALYRAGGRCEPPRNHLPCSVARLTMGVSTPKVDSPDRDLSGRRLPLGTLGRATSPWVGSGLGPRACWLMPLLVSRVLASAIGARSVFSSSTSLSMHAPPRPRTSFSVFPRLERR